MSLQSLAKTLQDQGRGNDSVLVHMTPKEVHGLQSLALAHGGSLTINPTTGLVEAGLLDSILSVGGGLLGGMVGGPLGAAIGSGLGTYVGGGSPQQALMSGVLGYGLSGLGGALESEGVNALNKQAMESLVKPEEAAMLAAESGPPNIPAINEKFGQQVSDITTKNNALPWTEKMGAGLGVLTDQPMQFAKDNLKYIGATGLGLAGMMAPGQTAAPGPEAKTGYAPRYTWNPQTRKYETAPAMPYTYYAANGGEVPGTYPQAHIQDKTDFYAQSTATPMSTPVVTDYDARINPQGDVMRAAGGGSVSRRRYVGEDTGEGPYGMPSTELDAIKRILEASNKAAQLNYAQGGIASLNEYAAGGKLLQGPGDGMSDSIPAVIKGAKPQRAALAQGEFVVPADVVSHLGNGSTDAGAKRLYAMMDKVRMARTGNKKQGRQINPEKFMPA
jgi:hypothetical protein